MKVEKILTRNFKNIQVKNGIEIDNLNIFIGPNGSGKSNVISTLKYLKDSLARVDRPKGGMTSFDDAIFNLGGSKALDGTIESPANIRLAFEFAPDKTTYDNQVLDIELLVQSSHKKVIVNQEALYTNTQKLFYFYHSHHKKSGEGVISVYTGVGKQTRFEPLLKVPVDELTFSTVPQLLEDSEYPPEKTPVYKVRREILEFISGWQFYNANNMNLNGIRLAEPKIGQSDRYLSPSGENLPLVLHNLIGESLDFEDRINNAMKSILPATRRIRAIPSGRLSLTAEWYMDGVREPLYLNEMSDGTVRMLCWAVILHSPALSPLLVIDEPEIGVHVAWMPILAEWIKQASQKVQIIICTHSPDLLDQFTDRVENVTVFEPQGRNKTHSVLKNLPKLQVEAWIEEGWKLGDLYRVGDPSVGGWPW